MAKMVFNGGVEATVKIPETQPVASKPIDQLSVEKYDDTEIRQELAIHREMISRCAEAVKVVDDKTMSVKLETEMKALKQKIDRAISITDEKMENIEASMMNMEPQPKLVTIDKDNIELMKHIEDINKFNNKRTNKIEEKLLRQIVVQNRFNMFLTIMLVLSFLI